MGRAIAVEHLKIITLFNAKYYSFTKLGIFPFQFLLFFLWEPCPFDSKINLITLCDNNILP
jgi:hypothetical protein